MNIGLTLLCICQVLMSFGDALQCWKCIGSDCSRDPSDLHQAVVVKCKKGESCKKVIYAMAEYNTSIKHNSVIKSCSSDGCKPTKKEEFYSCLTGSRNYHVMGCSLTLCCEDEDLCNTAITLRLPLYIWLFIPSCIFLFS